MARHAKTTARKQPTQERSRHTVDALLSATARVLVRDGYDRASTNRIAEEAGVSIGSLYQYFPSKEALVAALIERHTWEMTELLRDALVRVLDRPIPEAASELVRLMIASHGIDPKLHKVLTEQVPRVGRLDRLFDMEAQIVQLVRAYLEAHRHEILPRDLDVASFVLVQTVEALTHAAVVRKPELLGERLEREITALVVRYLGTTNGKSGHSSPGAGGGSL